MKKIGQISSFLSRNIGIVIIIFSIIAFFRPESFSWATNYTSAFLAAARAEPPATSSPISQAEMWHCLSV